MRNLIILLLVAGIYSCGSKKELSKESSKVSIEAKTTDSGVEFVKLQDVQQAMEYMASDELEGRNTGSAGIEKAAVYIESFFKENNIKPYFETYRDSFKVKKLDGYNVVGYLEGNDKDLKSEFVILGAHYDHIGVGKEVDGDTIANGANDDASGTIAVLEWARYFAKTKSNKRSVLFTLYSAEEMGLKGSEHLAAKLKEAGIDLYTMINFEMIGVPRAEKETMAYLTGFNLSNMAEKLNEYAKNDVVGFLPQAKSYSLFKRSDNYPFYQQFKIPAQAISTFDFTNFEFYHHVDDEVDKMDFNHMTSFMNRMIPALEGMINAATKEIRMHNE
ncbi:M28 family metallopeptidase [Cognatitamlana onchidii]|uniref:M28 family metallopeptidase n=1 Tax=Cognatitamlana onchidii TaxID=2562860 RepID=UPI0010A5AA7A|nr:M20/M25/M40 family metallo-hydrolase [Algibacter onchidii]